jgi:hypothetical protein
VAKSTELASFKKLGLPGVRTPLQYCVNRRRHSHAGRENPSPTFTQGPHNLM